MRPSRSNDDAEVLRVTLALVGLRRRLAKSRRKFTREPLTPHPCESFNSLMANVARWQRSAALLVVLLATTACGPGRIMKTPVVYNDGELDPFADLQAADQDADLELFFATDRKPREKPGSGGDHYGGHRGGSLRLGQVRVQFGKEGTTWTEHKDAALGGRSPSLEIVEVEEIGKLWTTIPLSADPDYKLALSSTSPDDAVRAPAREFARRIDEKLARSTCKDVLIFVPGFNITFPPTIKLAAQIQNYMGRQGAVIAFSWPAYGNVFTYTRDQGTGQVSARALRELMMLLSEHTKARRIHVMGYSAGAPIVTSALHQLRLIYAQSDIETIRALRIGIALFAGADVDLDYFRSVFEDRLGDLAEVVQVYFSSSDSSVSAGRFFYHNYARLGNPGRSLTDADRAAIKESATGVFIDVSDAQEHAHSSGHRYWYENDWVAADLVLALRYSLTPAQRGLVRPDGEALWQFPEDYPARARQALRDHLNRAGK